MLDELIRRIDILIKAVHELYFTALMLPMLLAVLWRAYARTFSLSIFVSTFASASITTCLSLDFVPFFVGMQKRVIDQMLLENPLAKSWHNDANLLSPQAAVFGIAFFSLLITQSRQRPWYKDVGLSIVLFMSIFLLTIVWLVILQKFVMPLIGDPQPASLQVIVNDMHSRYDFFEKSFTTAASFAMTSWIVGAFTCTFIQRHSANWRRASHYRIIDRVMVILITILILSFALCGFAFLSAYQATLWLLFWILAYPVALSFTRARPLQGANLVELYKTGLKQIPFLGDILAKVLRLSSDANESTSHVTADSESEKPPKNNEPEQR